MLVWLNWVCVGICGLILFWIIWFMYIYVNGLILFVQYSLMIFLGLIFLCSYVWFSGFVWFFLGLCSSVFLMKRMANLNSFILSSNFVFFIFYFVKIDQLIFKIKSWCGCLFIFFNHYFMLMWHFLILIYWPRQHLMYQQCTPFITSAISVKWVTIRTKMEHINWFMN